MNENNTSIIDEESIIDFNKNSGLYTAHIYMNHYGSKCIFYGMADTEDEALEKAKQSVHDFYKQACRNSIDRHLEKKRKKLFKQLEGSL